MVGHVGAEVNSNVEEDAGLVIRTLSLIFSIAEVDAGRVQTSISMSVAEMHNESMFDLLGDSDTNGGGDAVRREGDVYIRSAGGDAVYLEGLSSWPVHSTAEVNTLLNKNPRISSLQTKSASLRSHYVFTVEVLHVCGCILICYTLAVGYSTTLGNGQRVPGLYTVG
jgi:hypothetical protein